MKCAVGGGGFPIKLANNNKWILEGKRVCVQYISRQMKAARQISQTQNKKEQEKEKEKEKPFIIILNKLCSSFLFLFPKIHFSKSKKKESNEGRDSTNQLARHEASPNPRFPPSFLYFSHRRRRLRHQGLSLSLALALSLSLIIIISTISF